MVTFDPESQQYLDRLRIPFLNQEIGAGDIIAGITQALGVTPCTPCEERKKRLNQKLTLTPWGT